MTQAHVLIADDDDTTLEMLDAALQGRYRVSTAHGGHEAIQQAHAQAFDLIVLDVDMPGMDGYTTCTALKSSPRTADVPVLFLSALVNIEERLRGYRVGGTDYLTKPFDVDELCTKIDLAVAQRACNRRLNHQVAQALHKVQATASKCDEVGTVLDLQRQLATCFNYVDIARAFFNALDKLGFEGCLRLTGRQGVTTRSGQGECSALGHSILDHMETIDGPKVQAVGDNTSFNYGHVLMLVRNLPVHPHESQYSQDERDRLARVRDNIALMADSIIARMRALDVDVEKSGFEHTQRLIAATREALVDISAQQHANRMHLDQVFQRMRNEVEQSFIHLGLSESQEEQLSSTLQRHIGEAMAAFDDANQIESHLHKIIGKLHA